METGSAAYDRRPLLVATAIAAAIAVIAVADFRVVTGDIPGVPPACPLGDAACNTERNRVFAERIAVASDLDDEYQARSWLYAAGAVASVLAGLAIALVRTAPEGRRELFTDLGVISVLWLLGGVVTAFTRDQALVAVPTKAIVYPGLALAAVAGLGTLLTWGGPAGDPARAVASAARFEGRPIQVVGFGLTAIVVLIAAIALAASGGCEVDEPAWLVTLIEIGWFVAAVAAVMGLLSLLQRRWIAALFLLGAGPFASLIASLSIACLS